MRILILDDDMIRHAAFQRALVGCFVRSVTTVAECIRALEDGVWDYLFLDHDLGGEIYVDSFRKEGGTGYDVAVWLRAHPSSMPGTVIVHSFNSVGAANIKGVLPTCTVAPGAWKNISVS